MSEARELVDEIKDRFTAWRLRGRSGQDPNAYEATDISTDVPEIEFMPLDPFQASKPGTPRAFTDLTPAWIATQCPPHIFAQGQQLVTRKQVTRAVAHAGRLTGTTREQQFEDQEILLHEGRLVASCTCLKRTASPEASAASAAVHHNNGAAQAPSRTLPCAHVVAVLLAYLQAPPPALANPAQNRVSAQASGKLVCPVTRQPLNPNRAMFQCGHCGLYYSREGWEFIRKEARGYCCSCNARNTVKEVTNS